MTLANRLKLWLVSSLGYLAVRALGRTLRIRTLYADRVRSFWEAGRPVIIAFWHGRQLMMPLCYGGSRLSIMISEHRDGELIHRIVRRFGFDTVRGSTTRGGVRALRQMARLGRAGTDLAVTPDGPRGPRCIAQPGVVELAKLTGLPIVPLTFAASKKNFSEAGTASKSRCRSAGPALPGGSRSGFRRTRAARSLRRSGWTWKRRSTSSAMRRIAPWKSRRGCQRSAFSTRLMAEG